MKQKHKQQSKIKLITLQNKQTINHLINVKKTLEPQETTKHKVIYL